MYLKRLLAFLCCFTLVFCLFPSSAFATGGNGNIDGGGGSMGHGTSSNFWNSGNDGVRITVVDASSGTAVSSPLDFSNRTQKTSLLHFGKVNKLQYLGGAGLSLQSGVAYSCIRPTQSMPTIVSSKGQSNIEAIKRYFCSEYACMMVAQAAGVDYERMIAGEYKLLIEPIAYFTHNGQYYCMTATEAGLYDQMSGGNLRKTMTSLTHKNLPLSIPAGGTLQFEMPSDDPDNPDYEKNLVGVILHNHATCAYWPAGSEYDDDTTPLCSSVDGKVGIGTPGGACAACVMNRFGSAPDGSKGKACKNMRVLYLLRSGEYMPLQVNLPPTSIKPFKEFLNRAFMLRRRATYGSIVQIGLKRENNGTNDYSVATFKLLQDFQGEELAQIRAYANSFKEQIKLLLQQRAEITEEQRDTGCDYVIEPGAMTNEPADGHYTVSQINGDCEQLPA